MYIILVSTPYVLWKVHIPICLHGPKSAFVPYVGSHASKIFRIFPPIVSSCFVFQVCVCVRVRVCVCVGGGGGGGGGGEGGEIAFCLCLKIPSPWIKYTFPCPLKTSYL